MANRHKVTLTQAERTQLTELTHGGKSPTAKFIYARALLLCDAGEFGDPWKVADVADALGVTPVPLSTSSSALSRRGWRRPWPARPLANQGRSPLMGLSMRVSPLWPARPRQRVTAMDGATAGRQARRTQDRRFHLHHDGSALAKKNELQPHLSKYWKIPPDGDAAFVAAMGVGSTSRKSNSAHSMASACDAASRTSNPCAAKPPFGSSIAIRVVRRSTGALPLRMPGSN